MTPYMYITKRTTRANTTQTIAGTLKARHSFEALHNARIEATIRGADIRLLTLIKL